MAARWFVAEPQFANPSLSPSAKPVAELGSVRLETVLDRHHRQHRFAQPLIGVFLALRRGSVDVAEIDDVAQLFAIHLPGTRDAFPLVPRLPALPFRVFSCVLSCDFTDRLAEPDQGRTHGVLPFTVGQLRQLAGPARDDVGPADHQAGRDVCRDPLGSSPSGLPELCPRRSIKASGMCG
jgi:hypothetical protein